jgi:hypothetical protein
MAEPVTAAAAVAAIMAAAAAVMEEEEEEAAIHPVLFCKICRVSKAGTVRSLFHG